GSISYNFYVRVKYVKGANLQRYYGECHHDLAQHRGVAEESLRLPVDDLLLGEHGRVHAGCRERLGDLALECPVVIAGECRRGGAGSGRLRGRDPDLGGGGRAERPEVLVRDEQAGQGVDADTGVEAGDGQWRSRHLAARVTVVHPGVQGVAHAQAEALRRGPVERGLRPTRGPASLGQL